MLIFFKLGDIYLFLPHNADMVNMYNKLCKSTVLYWHSTVHEAPNMLRMVLNKKKKKVQARIVKGDK